ncbi:hypothetical protein [Escherichia phage IMM-001]|nr:hypothetical protein [Escherichia phage IMM-001]
MAIRSVALAGMVADTSLYNIDGACVVGGSAAIPVGTVVGVTSAQPVDGHKVVAATGITAANVLGVVVRSHYETPDGTARVNEAVNVMTSGRIWVRTTLDAAPAFGAPVLVSATGVVEEAGAVATGWTFAGGFIPNTGTKPQDLSVDGALVEVQVKQK